MIGNIYIRQPDTTVVEGSNVSRMTDS